MSLPLYNNSNNNAIDVKSVKLLNYHNVPCYLQHNPYIRTGYRRTYSNLDCLKSIFQFTNESVNIWTHLIGTMIFIYCLIYDNMVNLPNLNATIFEHVVMTIGLLCYMTCMLSSVGYHVFRCHSESSNRLWLSVDLFGICIGLFGCYIPGIYLAYYCYKYWRLFYMLLVLSMCSGCIIIQLHPRYKSHENFTTRMGIYVLFAVFGLVPTFHWIYLHLHDTTNIVAVFSIKVFRLYLLSSLSFIVYITKFPERFWPGRFDMVGASHQLWHILILVCFYDWRLSGMQFLGYIINTKCFQDDVLALSANAKPLGLQRP